MILLLPQAKQICRINDKLCFKNNHIKINKKYLRPEELAYLKGDASKARRVLAWRPEYSFEMIMDEMIEFWINFYNQNKNFKN